MIDWVKEKLPLVLPATWNKLETTEDGQHYVQQFTGLSLIVSGAKELDGRRWLHVSLAHPHRLPTWEELKAVKDWIIGREEYAVQVLPPKSLYVNQHPFCLHLFACVDGSWPLPDFTQGGGTL